MHCVSEVIKYMYSSAHQLNACLLKTTGPVDIYWTFIGLLTTYWGSAQAFGFARLAHVPGVVWACLASLRGPENLQQ